MTGTIHQPSVVIEEENLSLHDDSRIDAFCYINCSGGVEIGPESVIHCGSHVVGAGGLVMGARSVVTYNCVLATAVPGMDGPMSSMVDKGEVNRNVAPITLGDETFVGSCAVVMPGVTVHDAGVVAAGAYVDRDVPEATVLMPDGTLRERPGEW